MNYSIPNILSLFRVFIAPVVYHMIISGDSLLRLYALILFSFGAITDYLDGFIARKWGNTSSFGTFLDPIADKILTNAALLALMNEHIIDVWIILVIIGRDVFMTLFRVYADRVGQPIRTSFTAKAKTAIQLVFTIGMLLLLAFDSERGLYYQLITYINWTIWSIAIITVFTSFEYLIQNRKLLQSLSQEPLLPGIHTMIATFFGVGYSPLAPGTVATLFATLILLIPFNHFHLFILTCITLLVSIASIRYVEKQSGNDAALIVIDEVIGMWLILSFPLIPHTPISILTAILLFRIFDVFKPFPINLVNKQKGAFWVLSDDILAALFTILLMFALTMFQIGSNLLLMR
jgi:CDP-diacylglycerol--glycerol-3-phosphate 3-phosphatidyltransferase